MTRMDRKLVGLAGEQRRGLLEDVVDLQGAEKPVSIPFTTGVLADLGGDRTPPPWAERRFVSFDCDNFGRRMREIEPRLKLRVTSSAGEQEIELVFLS